MADEKPLPSLWTYGRSKPRTREELELLMRWRLGTADGMFVAGLMVVALLLAHAAYERLVEGAWILDLVAVNVGSIVAAIGLFFRLDQRRLRRRHEQELSSAAGGGA
jgi:hypothetical protein